MSDVNVNDLQFALQSGPTVVRFTKVDGTIRVMECTLNGNHIPQEPVVEGEEKKAKKENPAIQVVYDLEKQAWRSFRLDSVISYSLLAA